ncbi:L,D-transpeptidase family protein [Alicyclobacillus sp. ALC3]|nr:L,D-transpeptidase family protein [Alicyclobacillus sp. ALC3]
MRAITVVVGWVAAIAIGCTPSPALAERTVNAPSNTHSFIVVDTNQNRLTLYEAGVPVQMYSVGLGRPASPTPIGEWQITDKQRDWGGGFGTRWMRINVPWGIYGIHGTNKPHLVGGDVSSGCIRMRNQDVEQLYDRVGVGTPVVIEGNPLRYSRRLEYGNIGSDVLLVQDRLRRLGYYQGPRDGKFGSATEEALKKFEAAKGLPVDGVVGIVDYRALGLEE